ncbi:sigma-70 family RNA polymerase sigma factor [Pseudonocardia sp. GCM10023141]|uniref:sigma-70 family RNA polymerase sigma factor n=1 Tax=Pseudonocardia sp. GCM10023141 TaxID=3252653 RepID=UPI00361D2424
MADQELLARAQAGDERAFRELTEPYRHELQVHCYRIVGSVQDAEDILQETLLAAWRGLDRFEGRASVRAWLYRIATNRSLNALRDSARRPNPAVGDRSRPSDPIFLEPYPDDLLGGLPEPAPGPEARYESKESLSLAFVAGLQQLPPRQRAALVLRDVLGFRAAEAAGMLDSTEASVNSALQRARSTLEAALPARDRERAPAPRSAREREVVGRFADAFESGDIERVVALLTDDAWLTMPPEPTACQGPLAIAGFFHDRTWWGPDAVRLVAVRANGQPAFGYYLRDRQAGIARANGLIVLTLAGEHISAITRFGDNALLPAFGLPRTLPG